MPKAVRRLESITGASLPGPLERLRTSIERMLEEISGPLSRLRVSQLSIYHHTVSRDLFDLVLADALLRLDREGPEHPLMMLERMGREGMHVATVRKALAYAYGEGVGQDPVRAREFLQPLADQGVRGAAYHLAWIYQYGEGVSTCDTVAGAWYRAAADAGHREAYVALGNLYDGGQGLERDAKRARALYQLAESQGSTLGLLNLALILYQGRRGPGETWLLEPDKAAAVPLMERASDLGFADLQLLLGDAYHAGRGVKPDQTRALAEYRKAADNDLVEARYMVAFHLLRGLGARRNVAGAIVELEQAAAAEHPASCYQLGLLYAHGRGVERDPERAHELFSLAARRGHEEAARAAEFLDRGHSLPGPRADGTLPSI
jgi:TPR repeat protein